MAIRDRWPDLCNRLQENDGLPVRETGPWTEDKIYYWYRYVEITTRGMAKLWRSGLTYIDLFAGPGVCYNKHSRRRFPGSPLVAAWAPKPFRKIVAVELDNALASACEDRLKRSGTTSDFAVLQGDCNILIDRVVKEIPPYTLALAFVDPISLHFRFETLKRLARGARVDLLVLFPVGYDIVRNIDLYELQDVSRLDEVLGTTEWRTNWEEIANREARKIGDFFTASYMSRLKSELGFEVVQDTSIKHRGVEYYRLVYASNDERGLDFWNKALKKERGGQMGLGF
jgi:three-Cys-motif partner protein